MSPFLEAERFVQPLWPTGRLLPSSSGHDLRLLLESSVSVSVSISVSISIRISSSSSSSSMETYSWKFSGGGGARTQVAQTRVIGIRHPS